MQLRSCVGLPVNIYFEGCAHFGSWVPSGFPTLRIGLTISTESGVGFLGGGDSTLPSCVFLFLSPSPPSLTASFLAFALFSKSFLHSIILLFLFFPEERNRTLYTMSSVSLLFTILGHSHSLCSTLLLSPSDSSILIAQYMPIPEARRGKREREREEGGPAQLRECHHDVVGIVACFMASCSSLPPFSLFLGR